MSCTNCCKSHRKQGIGEYFFYVIKYLCFDPHGNIFFDALNILFDPSPLLRGDWEKQHSHRNLMTWSHLYSTCGYIWHTHSPLPLTVSLWRNDDGEGERGRDRGRDRNRDGEWFGTLDIVIACLQRFYRFNQNILKYAVFNVQFIVTSCEFLDIYRRKFRSQTSDHMDRWKAEMGRVREEKRRRKKIKKEKVSEERRSRRAKR